MSTEKDVLATVHAVRTRTRRVRRAGWIPLVMFGMLVVPAMAFHLQSRTISTTFENGSTRLVAYPYANVDGGQGLLWYWQLAIPLGYLLIAVLYTLRNRRAGIRTAVGTYLVTGIVLVIALYCFANSAVGPLRLHNFGLHGMEATITIGLALFVLARLERSVALAISAVLASTVAVAASQYNIANLWPQLFGLRVPEWLNATTNELALSAVLLLCAAAVALVDRTQTHSTAHA